MSYSQDEIYQKICQILEENFEIERSKITLDARLNDDLDIDSIDAVDLMIELKPITGKKMALEDFQEVKTVEDVVKAIHRVVSEGNT